MAENLPDTCLGHTARFWLTVHLALAGLITGCSRAAPEPPQVALESLDRALASLIQTSRQAVLAAPESAAAWGKLGQAFHAVEFLDPARVCYRRAVELDERSPRWVHLLGLVRLQDESPEALRDLARAAELAGSQFDAPRLRLAQALIERGRFEEAASSLAVILGRDPSHPAARLELARIRTARNDLPGAAEALEPCLTNAFTARPALLLLSQIRQRQGDAETAGALARRATAMPRPFDWPDPFLREVQRLRMDRRELADQINGLLMEKRLAEAESALSQFLSTAPDDSEAWLLQGRLRLQQRRCVEAEQAVRRHLAAQSNSLNGLMQLALAQLCQQHWADAAATLRQAVTLKPDFAQAHFNLGLALARLGDSQAAIVSFRDALRCSPGDANTHVALAEELLRAGHNTEASQHLQRALELDSQNPRARRLQDRLRLAPR